jgi:proteasome beta subunit
VYRVDSRFRYAVEVRHRSWFQENLTVNDAYKIAIQAIAAAIRRISGTGDGINVVIIDKDGNRELSKEMKKAVSVVY